MELLSELPELDELLAELCELAELTELELDIGAYTDGLASLKYKVTGDSADCTHPVVGGSVDVLRYIVNTTLSS